LLSLFVLGVSSSHANMLAYMEGEVQGVIVGDSVQQNYEGWIPLENFSHSIKVPVGTDGRPTGAPITSPFLVDKEMDRSTTALFRAISTSESFPIVRIDVTAFDGMQVAAFYRFDLQNALLVRADQAGSATTGPFAESYEFTYSRITISDLANGTSVTYDWNGAVGSATGPLTLLPKLDAPAPNPSKGPTEFHFALPEASEATLSLFDVRGRRVRQLHHGWTAPEQTIAVWDGKDDSGVEVAQGVYLVQLKYPGAVLTQRLVVLR
jgi:type VI secretion system Hcp family effector